MQFETDWTYINCEPAACRRIEDYWRIHYQEELRAMLDTGLLAPQTVRFAVTHNGNGGWEVQAVVVCAGQTVAATVEDEQVESALDQIVVQLAVNLTRAGDRTACLSARQAMKPADWDNVTPLLETFQRQHRNEAFFHFLTPLCQTMQEYVATEMANLQIDQTVAPGDSLVEGVLNETMLRAWDRFPNRAADQPLHGWLTKLVDRVLADMQNTTPEESLNEPCPSPDDDPAESRRDEWIDRVDQQESIERSELIDPRGRRVR